MKRTRIIELLHATLVGQQVNVKGWVRTRRGNKAVSFIALNDGSTIHNIQIVVDLAKFDPELLAKITTGASLSVIGELVSSQGQGQSVEIQASEIEVLGTADPATYPLQKKGHSLEFLRPPTSTYEYLRSDLPHASPHVDRYPYVLPRARLLLCPYPTDHGQRCRGCWADVPGHDS